MVHAQAYHTSCRDGLSGAPGFQYNAATPDLSPEALRALAEAHTGYHAPPGSPPEPSAEELAAFPVALKHRPVDGLGPVISRTVYVGRELRGRGGEPDAGRFGNYFSHIVVGGPAAEPFDGLLPIELWGAPHWTAMESDCRDLPPLEGLVPGGLDLDAVLGLLDGPRAGWLGHVLDAVLAALAGGPRAIVVEPDASRGGAWVAWASYALPPALAARLSFTTFSGRPRYAEDVELCVTTPDADLGFPSYDLGTRVAVLGSVDAAPEPRPSSLYARVATTLVAEEGPEALARAVLGLDGDPAADMRLGAELAVASGRAGLALDAERPALLAAVARRVRAGDWPATEAAVAALPPHAAPGEVAGWADVHAAARAADAPAAQGITDGALERLLDHVDRLPDGLPAVPAAAPTRPAVASLARWLELLETRDGAAVGAAVHGGLALGLTGCNAALDRRLAAALARALDNSAAQRALVALAGEPRHAALLDATVAALVARADGDTTAFETLVALAAEDAVRASARRAAEAGEDPAARATWERLRVRRDARVRPASLVALLGGEAPAAGAARRLFPGGAPATAAEHAELLEAYAAVGAAVPEEDLRRTLALLAELRLEDAGDGRLDRLVQKAHPAPGGEPLIVARALPRYAPPRGMSFERWAEHAAAALTDRALPAARRDELERLAGSVAAACLGEADYQAGLAALVRGLREASPVVLADGLRTQLGRGARGERTVARAFAAWRRAARGRGRGRARMAAPAGARPSASNSTTSTGPPGRRGSPLTRASADSSDACSGAGSGERRGRDRPRDDDLPAGRCR